MIQRTAFSEHVKAPGLLGPGAFYLFSLLFQHKAGQGLLAGEAVHHGVGDAADNAHGLQLAGQLEAMGIVCGVTDTMMDSFPRKEALARFVLEQK